MGCVVIDHKEPIRLEDYGIKDWHHDAEGRVSYPWVKPSKEWREANEIGELPKREDQRWSETCTEAAWDNMSYERNHHAAICEAFDEWERNQALYN